MVVYKINVQGNAMQCRGDRNRIRRESGQYDLLKRCVAERTRQTQIMKVVKCVATTQKASKRTQALCSSCSTVTGNELLTNIGLRRRRVEGEGEGKGDTKESAQRVACLLTRAVRSALAFRVSTQTDSSSLPCALRAPVNINAVTLTLLALCVALCR